TTARGATNVRRLYAAGEVAMTGLHGANRLASNSLLEALVLGHRAATDAMALLAADPTSPPRVPKWNPGSATDSDESVVATQNWDEIRRFMWNYVSIVRSNRRLARALRRITELQEEIQQYYWDFTVTGDLIELRNLAVVAELIIVSAIKRKESRGLHYNIDYPAAAALARDTILTRGERFFIDAEFLASLNKTRGAGPPPGRGGGPARARVRGPPPGGPRRRRGRLTPPPGGGAPPGGGGGACPPPPR